MDYLKTLLKTPVKEAQTVVVTAVKTEVPPPPPPHALDFPSLDSLPTNVDDVTAAVEDVQDEAADKLGDVIEDTKAIATDASAEVIVIATDAAGTLSEEIVDVIMPDDDKLPWYLKLVNCCGGRFAFLKLSANHAATQIDTDDLPGSAANIATTVSAVLPASAVTSVTLSAIPGVTSTS